MTKKYLIALILLLTLQVAYPAKEAETIAKEMELVLNEALKEIKDLKAQNGQLQGKLSATKKHLEYSALEIDKLRQAADDWQKYSEWADSEIVTIKESHAKIEKKYSHISGRVNVVTIVVGLMVAVGAFFLLQGNIPSALISSVPYAYIILAGLALASGTCCTLLLQYVFRADGG